VPEAVTELERAITVIQDSGAEAVLAEAYEMRANLDFVSGRDREALEWADRALALQRSLGLEEGIRALGIRGGVRAAQGDVGGIEDLNRSIALARAADDTELVTRQLNNLAISIWPFEGPSRALEFAREAVLVAWRRGLAGIGSLSLSTVFECLYDMGEWSELVVEGEAFLAGTQGDEWSRAFAQSGLELVRASRGEQATSELDGLVDLTFRYGEPQMMLLALLAAASGAAQCGDYRAAQARLAQLENVPDLREQWSYPRYLASCIRLAIALGDLEVAERLRRGVQPLTPLHRHAILAAEAALAESRGDRVESVELYTRAAEGWHTFGHVPEDAYAELGRGRCLAVLERPVDAADALRVAREMFVSLGAVPALAEIDELLGESTALTS
jgi:tetratricopeptide (TPR) repeat protein